MYKVFIVDDEPFIIEGLYDILDWPSFGLEIVGQAENGQRALDVLSVRPVDVLITDISMPVMNGLSLIREARKLHPDLKVIILSGFNEFDYLKEGMKLGIENYLLKPINIEELESTLRNTVEKLDSSRSEELYDAFDVQIIKDNTLYRWLTGQIAAAEFEERADLLGLYLNRPFIATAVLRPVESGTDVFDWVRRRISGEQGLTLFRDVDGDLVLIASIESWAEGKRDFTLLLEQLSIELSDLSRPVQISIGSVGEWPEEAAPSYREAKRALEYFMVYPDRRVMDFTGLESDDRKGKMESALQWPEYVKLILARDEEGLTDRIAYDFEQMRVLGGIGPQDLTNRALELVVRFKMELEEIRHTEEEAIFKKGLEKVRSSTAFHDLVAALQEVARETVHALLQDSKNPVVSQVLAHIHDHYADELSLKTLGAQYHIHPVYLGQLFHKETGESFAEYINKYRIDQAKYQLKHTNLKVQEIARNVGYWETGYFYKQFKKYVGISPTDFKAL
ncbi:response regulator transcription factor [Paenibacillus physcomitrellae]|uniref:DNA-binding response regulator n=1 Tax=Paenibacillus physcomitrellae TaxID=1619311 RepID=A0ABQ1FV05_9BACL|nr:response regulator transcription factor [Paenibacillus physcomitrellae]GGA30872.1 DNA-binding response regulator [Paenibacillus physcomitrellae]